MDLFPGINLENLNKGFYNVVNKVNSCVIK